MTILADNWVFKSNNPFKNYGDYQGKESFSSDELKKLYMQHHPDEETFTMSDVVSWLEELGCEVQPL